MYGTEFCTWLDLWYYTWMHGQQNIKLKLLVSCNYTQHYSNFCVQRGRSEAEVILIRTWPQLRNFEAIAPSTALSISALLKTTNGAFPPSSNASLLTPDELCLYSNFPTAVEPINNEQWIFNSSIRILGISTEWHSNKQSRILQPHLMRMQNFESIH